MRICALCLLLAAGIFAPPSGAQTTPVNVSHSLEFSLHSSVTQRDYLIQVAIPDQPPPAQGYRVLYVLDGNAYWPLLRAAHQQFGRHGRRGKTAPLLIVGVGYPNTDRFNYSARADDYTPRRLAKPADQHHSHQQPRADKNRPSHNDRRYGGAAKFLEFMQQQLKPAIAARFKVDARHEAIFGHSFGGLFVSYALLAAPQSFDAYLAISPSLWWDQAYVSHHLTNKRPDLSNSCVFLGVGSEEHPRQPRGQASPYPDSARMAGLLMTFSNKLGAIYPALYIDTQVFDGETHGTSVWPGSRYALKSLRQCWQ